jgi:hypothetical protein
MTLLKLEPVENRVTEVVEFPQEAATSRKGKSTICELFETPAERFNACVASIG